MYKARISVVLLWWVISATSFLCLDTREAISAKYPSDNYSEAKGVCDSVEAKTTDACKGEFYQQSPIWSPDGKKFAFLKWITQKLHTIMIFNTEDGKISSLFPISRPSPAGDSIIREIETKDNKGDDEPTIKDFAWGPDSRDSRHYAFLRISKKRDENGIFIGELGKSNTDKLKTGNMEINRIVWSNQDAEGKSFIAYTVARKCFIQKINKINNGYVPVGDPLRILRYSAENISYPAFSPDGKELVVSVGYEDKFKLVRCNIAESINNEEYEPEELTYNVGGVSDICPVYSPDGRYIAFYSTRETTSPNKYTLWVLDLKEKGFRRAKRVWQDYISRSDISFMSASWLDKNTVVYKKDTLGELYPVYKVEIKDNMEFTKPEILPPFNTEHKGLQKNTTVIDFSVSPSSKAIAFSHQIIETGFRVAWIALKEPSPPEKPKESAVLPDKKKVVRPESCIKNIYLNSAVLIDDFGDLTYREGANKTKDKHKEEIYSLDKASTFLKELPERTGCKKRISDKDWEVVVFQMIGGEGEIIQTQRGVTLDYRKRNNKESRVEIIKFPRGSEELLKAICDKSGFKENSTIHFLVRKGLRLFKGEPEPSQDCPKCSKIDDKVMDQKLLAIVVINGKGKRNIYPMEDEVKYGFPQDNPDIWKIDIGNQ